MLLLVVEAELDHGGEVGRRVASSAAARKRLHRAIDGVAIGVDLVQARPRHQAPLGAGDPRSPTAL